MGKEQNKLLFLKRFLLDFLISHMCVLCVTCITVVRAECKRKLFSVARQIYEVFSHRKGRRGDITMIILRGWHPTSPLFPRRREKVYVGKKWRGGEKIRQNGGRGVASSVLWPIAGVKGKGKN